MNILVIDDEKVILDLAGIILKNRGFDVVGTSDYSSAFKLISEMHFDVILANFKTDKLLCIDLIKQCTSTEYGPAVIAFVSKGEEENAVKIMKAGAYDYIIKPFNNHDLVERIQQCHKQKTLENEILRLQKLLELDLNNKIIRSIEFEPEYYQAGLSILSYFNTIVSQKYPDIKIKVKIEQEGSAVRMLIETPDGEKEKVEKTLVEYGLVVLGQISPESFLPSPYEVMALKNKIEISALELRQSKELLRLVESNNKVRIDSLEEQVTQLNRLLAEGLKGHNKSNDIILKILDTSTLSNEIANDLRQLLSKTEKGIFSADEQEVKRILKNIQLADPKILYDLRDFIRDSVVGVSGNFLYSWIVSIIACLPK
jgi:response regulator of citrate/malate metabolism